MQSSVSLTRNMGLLWLILSAALPASALAAPAWIPFTDSDLAITEQLSLARTDDGVLHVVWRTGGATLYTLWYRAVDAAGNASGAVQAIASGWDFIYQPAVLPEADGSAVVYFTGNFDSDVSNPLSDFNLYAARSDVTRSTWTLASSLSPVDTSGDTTISAVHSPLGQDFATWTGLSGISYLAIGGAVMLTPWGCCSYESNLAVDGVSGEVVLTWFSNQTNRAGTYTQTIAPTMGDIRFVPGSATADRASALQAADRIPITGRKNFGGTFVAHCVGYPTCKQIRVWRHDSGTDRAIARAKRGDNVAITADPATGRLWVFWRDGSKIYGARSNLNATTFPAKAFVKAPGGNEASQKWGLFANASRGNVDVFLIASGFGPATGYHMHLTDKQFSSLAQKQK